MPDVSELIERLLEDFPTDPTTKRERYGEIILTYREERHESAATLAAQAAEIARLRAEPDEAWHEGAEAMRAEFLAGIADVASAKDAIAFVGGKPSWDDACRLHKTMITYLPIPERKT